MNIDDVVQYSTEKLYRFRDIGFEAISYAVSRSATINVTMDLKGPYIVIPELGSLQK